MSHPAACPYCGGTIVNQAQPDFLLRDVRLNVDGSISVGQVTDSSDFHGASILFCHGCGSEYPQPKDVVERYEDSLKVNYDYKATAHRGDPQYLGHTVRYEVHAMPNQEPSDGNAHV